MGSWVREAALKALSVALKAVDASSAKGFSVSPDLLDKIIGEMMRQGVEKIDRVRETAGQSMKAALSLSIANTPSMASAIKVFNNKSTPINWLNPADVFPAMVPLLHLPEFRTQLLTGIIVSVGGLTESLVSLCFNEKISMLCEKQITQ